MKAAEILRRAADLSEERQRVHGRSEDNMKHLAAAWTVWLHLRFGDKATGIILQESDAAMMMAWSKDVRFPLGEVNADDTVDGCGYRAIAGQASLRVAGIANAVIRDAHAAPLGYRGVFDAEE